MATDWRREYWIECVSIGANDCGAKLTQEQIEFIAAAVESGHDNYGMYSGGNVASSNFAASSASEKDALKKELQRERAKVVCQECGGRGRLQYSAGPWAVDTGCTKCHGDGRHDP